MLSINHISLQFDDHQVLRDASLHVAAGERVALIGRNGTGKTTLLRLVAGELKPDSGHIKAEKSVGYLPQQPEDASSTLSGGQQTRAALARLLGGQPGILVLDEPTNHLDAETLEWLAQTMRNFRGAILFTSHDRAFIDEVATGVVELKDGGLTSFGGNYSFAKDQQERELAGRQARFEAQETYKQRLEDDIARTKEQASKVELSTTQVNTRRYAKKVARKAVTREKRLEKQMEGGNWEEKPFVEDRYRFSLGGELPAGKRVLEFNEVSKSFGGKTVLDRLSFEINGSERVWLSGPNGSGKTTLLQLALGLLEPDSGSIKRGTDLEVGYVSQEVGEQLSAETGLAELASTGAPLDQCYKQARNLGLKSDKLEQPLTELSRGQLTKLMLAKLLLKEPQLLILDEPTNHLDIETREDIEEALCQYKGAMLVVSHDRYFLDQIGISRELALS